MHRRYVSLRINEQMAPRETLLRLADLYVGLNIDIKFMNRIYIRTKTHG